MHQEEEEEGGEQAVFELVGSQWELSNLYFLKVCYKLLYLFSAMDSKWQWHQVIY